MSESGIDPARLETRTGQPVGSSCRHYDKETGRNCQFGLTQQVAMRPTPTQADGMGGPGRSEKRTGGDNLRNVAGGSLNPTFVEFLQGWPRGWTDLAPIDPQAMADFYSGTPWQAGEWPGVPRIATGIPQRVARLKALGNGQVPACAEMAWQILLTIEQ